MKKEKLRNDTLLFFAIIVVFSVLIWIFTLTRSEGAYAVVLINGEEKARYPLSKDAEIEIKYDEDESFNILKIENGTAKVISASCPDLICVSHKPVKYNGETIVCLPNKLVIRIDSDKNGVDAVA